MPKTAVFTTITPLPRGIARKSVLDMYHDHLAMIDLNPLVVERFACKPPSYAPTDEYYKTWYTIKDKVSYLPGGLASGSVSYHACFHDTPEGLQTHVYAPLGLDIQARWTVGGRLAGEPILPEEPDVDLNLPKHGLYIREDVQMRCSSLLIGFVKKTFKDSHASLVDKLVERAHVLESNFANQRLQALRNIEPRERSGHGDIFIAPPPGYSPTVCEFLNRARSPALTVHSRASSDPILSPGLTNTSSISEQSSDLRSPRVVGDKHISFRFVLDEKPNASSAPEAGGFLLPATTYDGGFSQKHDRPLSLYPGSPSFQVSESRKTLPSSPRPIRNQQLLPPTSAPSLAVPRDSYAERPVSFQFDMGPQSPFNPQSPFDRKSAYSQDSRSSDDLLDDIDNAIDEVFMFTVPSNTYETLPATTFQRAASPVSPLVESNRVSGPLLTSAKYEPEPQIERKDSAMRLRNANNEIVPPVPIKDDKYLRKRADTIA